MPRSARDAASFAAMAYVDELVLCSTWAEKPRWQAMPLQREHYRTTNAGAEFYTRLEKLGEDEWGRRGARALLPVHGTRLPRQVFQRPAFRRVHGGEARNLRLLLPDSDGLDLQAVTLFPEAYSNARAAAAACTAAERAALGVRGPDWWLLDAFLLYHHYIAETLTGIQALLR